MAEGLSSTACFERLGIPAHQYKTFQEDVENYFLEVQTGNPISITAVDKDDLKRWTLGFIRSNSFQFKRQPVPGRHPPPSEVELHCWLFQLVNTWVEEKDRRESQDDPSYSASMPGSPGKAKKRKRPSDVSTPSKPSVSKPAKRPCLTEDSSQVMSKFTPTPGVKPAYSIFNRIAGVARSPTVECGSATEQDIPYKAYTTGNATVDDDSEDDELPDHAQLLSQRPNRDIFSVPPTPEPATIPASSKGKAPVRDPPGLPPIKTNLRRPAALIPGSSRTDPYPEKDQAVTEKQADIPVHEPVMTDPIPRPSQSSRMREIESLENSESQDSIIAEHLNFLGSPSLNHSQPEQVVQQMTPPPTACPPRFIDADAHITAHTNSTNPPTSVEPNIPQPQDQRSVVLLRSIVDYVKQCELHSYAIAEAATSSPREVTVHRIRASAFYNLHGDITSRVDSFLRGEEGMPGTGKVRNYSLWS